MRGMVTVDDKGCMHDGSHVTIDDETVLLLSRSRTGSRVHSERLADTLGAQGWCLVEDTIQRHTSCLTFEVERLHVRDDLGVMLEEMIHKLGPLVPPGASSRDPWMVTSASRITWAEEGC